MHHNIYASILVMFLTIYAVRALPLTLIRREIRNPFIQSFLYYVPYVSLSVMTFPSILSATGNRITGIVGFVAGMILAWIDGNLFRVSIGACVAVYIAEMILHLSRNKRVQRPVNHWKTLTKTGNRFIMPSSSVKKQVMGSNS